MADRCVAAFQDDTPITYYLWDNGFLVSFNAETKEWAKFRVKHPSEIADAPTEPNRELAPEVADA